MSQSAVVAVAAAFIVNGIINYAGLVSSMPGLDWIISGVIAFIAGYATMKMGGKK